MSRLPDSLDVIATPPPTVPEGAVRVVLEREYGLGGTLTPLVSERDQNYRLDAGDQGRFVVKIANSEEPYAITDFQVAALQHLERAGRGLPVPRVRPTLSGKRLITITPDATQLALRVVSYLPGRLLEGHTPDAPLARDIGGCLARLDRALSDFSHAGESQVLLWDMQRAGELRPLLQFVPGTGLRALVAACIDEFDERLEPALSGLRKQVIHNDLNPGNVLLTDSGPPAVAGVIDFGDMLRAPLVVDLAIAGSYLRSTDDELATLRAFIAGFEDEFPLEDAERMLVFDLMRTRLAATVAILYWRRAARSADDPYLARALEERGAERFLRHLSHLGRERVTAGLFGTKT